MQRLLRRPGLGRWSGPHLRHHPLCESLRGYLVQFQETPNEACYKFFVKDHSFLEPGSQTMLFDGENSYQSPLAHELMSALPMIEEVTIGETFVTVRRVEASNARAAARYFAMKFHGHYGGGVDDELEAGVEGSEEAAAAERSERLQRRAREAMREDEEGCMPAPASSLASSAGQANPPPETPGTAAAGSQGASRSFEMGGYTLEQAPETTERVDEAVLQEMIEAMNWAELRLHVSALLTDHMYSGAPHVSPDAPHPHADTLPAEGDSEVVLILKELLATTIRPQLQADGGDIRFVRFNEATREVEVELLGACRTCKSSKTTLVDLIERTTLHWVPEVKAVREVVRVGSLARLARAGVLGPHADDEEDEQRVGGDAATDADEDGGSATAGDAAATPRVAVEEDDATHRVVRNINNSSPAAE